MKTGAYPAVVELSLTAGAQPPENPVKRTEALLRESKPELIDDRRRRELRPEVPQAKLVIPVCRASFATRWPGIKLQSCAKTVSLPLVGVGRLKVFFFTPAR